jgi:hypothetical protein
MRVMAEINRVLSTGGLLLLTTPNIASARGLEAILKGDSPYFWGSMKGVGCRQTTITASGRPVKLSVLAASSRLRSPSVADPRGTELSQPRSSVPLGSIRASDRVAW